MISIKFSVSPNIIIANIAVITGPNMLIKDIRDAPIYLMLYEINNKGRKVQKIAIKIMMIQPLKEILGARNSKKLL